MSRLYRTVLYCAVLYCTVPRTLSIVDWFISPLDTLPQSFLQRNAPPLPFVGPEKGGLRPQHHRAVVLVNGDAGHVGNENLTESVLNVLDEEENSTGAVNVDVHAEFVTLLERHCLDFHQILVTCLHLHLTANEGETHLLNTQLGLQGLTFMRQAMRHI